MTRPRPGPRVRLRHLRQGARRLVEAVAVDGVRAEVDREDMAAVRAGEELVRVRSLLPGTGWRSGVRDQVGALAEGP